MQDQAPQPEFVVCVKNDGYPASLEKRKIYRTSPDPDAAAHGLLRVVDESGEDYLYPHEYFSPISLPTALAEVLSLVGD